MKAVEKDGLIMEVNHIKELVEMMKENDLSELEIVDGQTRVMLKRGTAQPATQVVAMPHLVGAGGMAAMPVMEAAPAGAVSGKSKEEENPNLVQIVSPMVGTFYSAPSPTAKPFVEVGSKIEEETVVCIIEAMKVMNEIKGEKNGIIRKVLVENGAAVEYGQALFLVELN